MKNIIITILIVSNLFLTVCIFAMVKTVDNVRVENNELWQMVDKYGASADENF